MQIKRPSPIGPMGALLAVTSAMFFGLAGPGAAAAPPAGASALPSTAYVTNFGAGSISPIDTSTNVAGTAFAVGSEPGAIAITPDGTTAYVADESLNVVIPVRTATNTSGRTDHRWGPLPFGIAITPDGKTAYVTNGSSNTVTPIDTATNTTGIPDPGRIAAVRHRRHPRRQDRLRGQLPLEHRDPDQPRHQHRGDRNPRRSDPFDIAITPDGTTAYVANSGTNTVTPSPPPPTPSGRPITVGPVIHGHSAWPSPPTATPPT